jgi:phosphate transporter
VLKRRIYQLEKRQFGRELDLEANESASLLHDGEHTDTDAIFTSLLDRELKKIKTFYGSQERELLDELAELEIKIKEHEEAGLAAAAEYYDDYVEEEDEDDEDDEENSTSPTREPGSRPPQHRRRKTSSAGYSTLHRKGQLPTLWSMLYN